MDVHLVNLTVLQLSTWYIQAYMVRVQRFTTWSQFPHSFPFGLFKGWELKFNSALLSSLPWEYQKEQPKPWSSTFKIIIMFYQNEVCYIWRKKFKDYKSIQNGGGKFWFHFIEINYHLQLGICHSVPVFIGWMFLGVSTGKMSFYPLTCVAVDSRGTNMGWQTLLSLPYSVS